MKYRKKPIDVEAFKYGFEQPPEWFNEAIDKGIIKFPVKGHDIVIKTLEGQMGANAGAYIIRGAYGELYPCAGAIFESTYEKAED